MGKLIPVRPEDLPTVDTEAIKEYGKKIEDLGQWVLRDYYGYAVEVEDGNYHTGVLLFIPDTSVRYIEECPSTMWHEAEEEK